MVSKPESVFMQACLMESIKHRMWTMVSANIGALKSNLIEKCTSPRKVEISRGQERS